MDHGKTPSPINPFSVPDVSVQLFFPSAGLRNDKRESAVLGKHGL
jgi:hypothetical protein